MFQPVPNSKLQPFYDGHLGTEFSGRCKELAVMRRPLQSRSDHCEEVAVCGGLIVVESAFFAEWSIQRCRSVIIVLILPGLPHHCLSRMAQFANPSKLW